MKKRNGTRLLSLMLCIVLVCSLASGISAAESPVYEAAAGDNVISPYYLYINSTNVSLSISSGSANMSAKLTGISGVTTKVSITMTLQKKSSSGSWTNVISYSDTFNGYTGSLSRSYSVSGGTYRVKADFTAYKGSLKESVTQYSAERAN